jgi:hypothetical protein
MLALRGDLGHKLLDPRLPSDLSMTMSDYDHPSDLRDSFFVSLPDRALKAAAYRGLTPQQFVEQAVELSIFEAEVDAEDDLEYKRRVLIGGLRAVLDKAMSRSIG